MDYPTEHEDVLDVPLGMGRVHQYLLHDSNKQVETQLKKCAYALMEELLYEDYSEFLNAGLKLRYRQLRGYLARETNVGSNWTEIADGLRDNKMALADKNKISHTMPVTPWIRDLNGAVDKLGGDMNVELLYDIIIEVACRMRGINSSKFITVSELFRTNEPILLGLKIQRDLKNLDIAYSNNSFDGRFAEDRSADKERMRIAIQACSKRYLVACKPHMIQARVEAWSAMVIPRTERRHGVRHALSSYLRRLRSN